MGGAGCALCLAWFMLSLPSFGVRAPASPLPHSDLSLTLVLTLCGIFAGVATPLFYELAAELLYPAKESTSAGILVFIMNAIEGVMIYLNNDFTASGMNCTMVVAVLIVWPVI